MSFELLQTRLYEQYRTEHFGPWHTRECYPWEYDAQVQECMRLANRPFDWCSEKEWFLQQAKIWQDRSNYIRQEWARQEALQAVKQVTQKATPPAPPTVLQESTHPSTQSVTQQADCTKNTTKSTTKKKRRKKKKKSTTSSSSNVNTSPPSTISGLRTMSTSRESPSYPSNAPLLASKHAPLLASKQASIFTSQHAFLLASRLASPLGYIRHAEDMEATGQG